MLALPSLEVLVVAPRPSVRWWWWLLVPVVLAGVAWAALAVLLPPARVRAIAERELSRRVAREVRFASVRVGLFPPVRVTVRALEVAEPGGFDAGSLFACEAVRLDLDPWALWARRVRVQRLHVDSPTLHVAVRADGSSNLDGLVPADTAVAAGPALDLEVREFRVRDGRVLVDHAPSGRRVLATVVTRASLETRGERVDTEGSTEVTGLAVGPLTALRRAELDTSLAALRWVLDHRGAWDGSRRRLALATLALRTGGTAIGCSGVVDEPGPRARFDLRARADGVDLAQVLSWVAVADAPALRGVSGRGALACDLALRGGLAPGAGTRLTGTLAVRDGALRWPGAPTEVSGVSFTAAFRPDSLEVADLRATVAGQPLRAELLAWSFAAPRLAFAVRGELDLAAVGPLVAPPGARVAGRVALDVRGRGPLADPGAFALAGEATLRGVSVEGAGTPRPVTDVNGRLALSATRVEVRDLQASAGASSVRLDARVDRPLALLAAPGAMAPAAVSFDLRSPSFEPAAWLPATSGAPALPNARGTGRVAIARLRQDRLDVSDVRAEVRLEPGVCEVTSFACAGYGGRVRGEARFDLRDAARPGYRVRARVDEVLADSLLGAWTPLDGLVRGTLGTTLDLSGEGLSRADLERTLTLVGLAALREGRIGPGPTLDAIASFVRLPSLRQLDVARLELPIRIEHGRVTSDGVTWSGSTGEWRFAGAVGFDGVLDGAVSVTLPPSAVAAVEARSALAAGALTDAQGRMLIDLRVSGPARAPRVTWDTEAMRARLAGRAAQGIAEQRARLEAEARAAAAAAAQRALGGAGDSTAVPAAPSADALRDTVRAAARDLWRGLLGRPARTPVPGDSTRR